MNHKARIVSLITIILLVLSAIFVNLLTNDKNVVDWFAEIGFGTKMIVGVVIVITFLLLALEFFKPSNQNLNESTKNKSGVTQNQRSGDNSHNYQAGGNIVVNNAQHQEFTDNSQELLAKWTTKTNVNVNSLSEEIPASPLKFSEFHPSENNVAYWNKPFNWNGNLRIFEGQGWTEIWEFPHTLNHCSDGMFMIRWRSANPDVHIETAVAYSPENITDSKIGKYGFMSGNNCEQPLFKFADTINNNESTLVDIYYELKFWQASP